jgi:hypothetical protein
VKQEEASRTAGLPRMVPRSDFARRRRETFTQFALLHSFTLDGSTTAEHFSILKYLKSSKSWRSSVFPVLPIFCLILFGIRILCVTIFVSLIGLGCMGMSWSYGPPKDKQEMLSLIHAAFGIGFVPFCPSGKGFLTG